MEIQRRWRESQVFFLVLELLFLAVITHLYAHGWQEIGKTIEALTISGTRTG